MKPRILLTIALICLGLIAAGCRHSETEPKSVVMPEECPADMVPIPWTKPFCMDLYEYPNEIGQVPETGVGVDGAAAACAEKGKRLCARDEWVLACQGLNRNRYTYGDTHSNQCMDALSTERQNPEASGTRESCVSGFGVRDMSGSVFEWAADPDPSSPFIYAMGGSYKSQFTETLCAFSFPFLIEDAPTAEDFGFRCCWSPE